MTVQAAAELDFIIDKRVRVVCDHWRALLADGEPPERRTIDPGAIRAALPFTWIAERETGRFCLRLAGEEVNRLFGESIRRQYIDDIFSEPVAAEVARKLDLVVDTPAVIWTWGPFFEATPQGPSGECAVLPLAIDGAPRALLGVTVPSAAIVEPPRRLYPICQEKRIVLLADLQRVHNNA